MQELAEKISDVDFQALRRREIPDEGLVGLESGLLGVFAGGRIGVFVNFDLRVREIDEPIACDYVDRHPGPEDVPLVIEVADSSVSTDRSTKQRLYATAEVARYWLVNLPDSQVEVYEHPDSASGKYTQQTTLKAHQTLVWNLSPTQRLEINVADLFR